jgi:hypothetical protein
LLELVVWSWAPAFRVVVSVWDCLDELSCTNSCAFDGRVFLAGGSLSIPVDVDAFCCCCCCCCCCRARRAATALTAERGATQMHVSSQATQLNCKQQKNKGRCRTSSLLLLDFSLHCF